MISDIVGLIGLSIIDAIIAGERDRKKMANLTDPRIKADRKTIIKSLEGDFRLEHIFTLKQALSSYRHYQQMIRDCDLEIENHLTSVDSDIDVDHNSIPPSNRSKSKEKDDGSIFDLRSHLHRLFGTDLTLIDGISTLTSQKLYTEIGPDLSMFPTANHFCSWLGLSPQNKISGGGNTFIKNSTRFQSCCPSLTPICKHIMAKHILSRSLLSTDAYHSAAICDASLEGTT